MTDKEENDKEKKEEPEIPEEELVETEHETTIDGQKIEYIARAGTMILRKEEEEKKPQAKATVFFISYTKKGVKNPDKRPITFSFNGGPGSSSVWLHLGLLGPKRVIAEEDEKAVAPPYQLVENEFSLLDKTDLVFIDPVSTGYSRPVPGEKAEQFHEYKKDIEFVGEFIRLYTSRYEHWATPKFLIGESYGTTRAAGLSGFLQDKYGMYLNGIMLVSSILNFQTARFGPGNDMPYMFFLPTYTAIAAYHNKLSEDLQSDLEQTLSEVRDFVTEEYNLALMEGDSISDERAEEIATKLARYSGLSKDYLLRTDLRINIHRFCKELLREEGKTVGRLDGRFVGIDRDDAGENFEYDPSYSVIQGPYTATFNDYVARDLEYKSDLPYEILAPIYEKWKYEDYQNQFLNVGETLRSALSKNQFLQVFVANGYYDLATPFFATEYTFNHLQLDESLRENIRMEYYKAGHMEYLHLPSLRKMRNDLVNFINTSINVDLK